LKRNEASLITTTTTRSSANGADLPLKARNILLVEDEYLLADEARMEFEAQGATVIGPAATVEQALELLKTNRVDAALLDIRLRGELFFAVAQFLLDKAIPFLFVTGYDALITPEQFRDVPRFTKPADYHIIARALLGLL
jgi:DNA-binding LytR/AlgR family response regulator